MLTFHVVVIIFSYVLVFFVGYLAGKLKGWQDGYDKCSEDTMKTIDDYHDKKSL